MKEMQFRVPRYTQPHSPHHAAKRFGRLATAVLIALAAACLALPQAAARAAQGPRRAAQTAARTARTT
ncbi:putative phospholipid-binding domain protein [Burkholderia pseudomallei]|nr:putative phospholipid-binding domain protein [Burkholderia pseudomallei]